MHEEEKKLTHSSRTTRLGRKARAAKINRARHGWPKEKRKEGRKGRRGGQTGHTRITRDKKSKQGNGRDRREGPTPWLDTGPIAPKRPEKNGKHPAATDTGLPIQPASQNAAGGEKTGKQWKT